MTRIHRSIVLAASFSVVGLAACATTQPPTELVSARMAYADARTDALKRAPVEVHEAGQALTRAEAAFRDKDIELTRDMAYIAERKAELALVRAHTRALAAETEAGEQALLDKSEEARRRAAERLTAEQQRAAQERAQSQAQMEQERAQTQAQIEAERQLAAERQSTLEAERAEQQRQLEAERQARLDAEQKLADTMKRLDEVANVREEPQQIVITLPGEVLFQTGKATLTGPAQAKLTRVVDAVLAAGEGAIRIEGHTDSQGSSDFNQRLSDIRAEAVKNFLIDNGVARDRVQSLGMGETSPVVPNDSATNRALNRRVEIIVQKK
jgi:outer membrane protein OmpA-like peptidoglycan-associated protein